MDRVECKACGASLDADRLDSRLMMIACDRCGCVFSWTADGSAVRRPAAVLPVDFKVEEQDGMLRISWPFARSRAIFLGIFGLPMGLLPFIAVAMGAQSAGGASLVTLGLAAVCLLPFLALGLLLINGFLAALLNVHVLEAGAESLVFRSRPMPYPKPRPIARTDVAQLYVNDRGVEVSHKSGFSFKSTEPGWKVIVRTVSGESRVLINGLESPIAALYIEQRIEEHLGLIDRVVEGDRRGDS